MEYQIGNFVSYKGETVQIDNELLAKYLLNQLDEPFRPIKINEQWLLRFGFRNFDGFHFTILDKSIYITNMYLESSGHWMIGSSKIQHFNFNVRFLHELQNAVSHFDQTSIDINIHTEIEILGAKLFNLSPVEQQIEILKKQIELYYGTYRTYDNEYKAEQLDLLTVLENLRLKKS